MDNVRTQFFVIDIATEVETAQTKTAATQLTQHAVERQVRVKAYHDLNLLNNNFVCGFLIDTGHKDGQELHMLNDNGLIYIFNKRRMRLITILGARPGQIARYFKALNLPITQEIQAIINKAYTSVINNGVNHK